MAKKLVKKRKLKVFRLLLILLVLGALFFAVSLYIKVPIKNTLIKGTSILNDMDILEEVNINNYPSFILTSRSKIKKTLENNPYIKKVEVHKKFYNVLEITIEENKALFRKKDTNKLVLSSKEEIKTDIIHRVPVLMNYIPNTKYNKFIKGMTKIKSDILGKISEIEYQPNEYDKDRFLLYMDDGNSVYLTLTKFDRINYYNDVLTQLEDKKGILYLDSGNHFKIME